MQTITEYFIALLFAFAILVYIISMLRQKDEIQYDENNAAYLLSAYKEFFIPDETEEQIEFLHSKQIEPFTLSEKLFICQCLQKLECRRGFTHLTPKETKEFDELNERKRQYDIAKRPNRSKLKRYTKEDKGEFTEIKTITLEL